MLHVVAGVLTDSAGRVLVNRRLPGKPMAGLWEFPGGKLERGEDRLTGLERELKEELGIHVERARPLLRFNHDYADFPVTLDIWAVEHFSGKPSGLQGQELRWVAPADLPGIDLLEADRPIVTAIGLPDRYLITGAPSGDLREYLEKLRAALDGGVKLVQLRSPGEAGTGFRERALGCLQRCRASGARLLLNGAPRDMTELASDIGADGIHVPARHLDELRDLRANRPRLIGASCHDARELEVAERAGADFVVLGPVAFTSSHPQARPIGWREFAALVEPARIPVYAVGGMRPEDLPEAWAAGAQGIAAIGSLWGI